jgi:autotransporter-associated beta strand protein
MKSMRSRLYLLAAVNLAMARVAPAIVYRSDETDSTAQALAVQPQFSGTGIVAGYDGDGTGTLISPNWVLTARHVVTDSSVPGNISSPTLATTATFYLPGGNWTGTVYTDTNSDLALIHFTTPIPSNYTPIAPNANTSLETDHLVWKVGYGEHGTVGGTLSYDSTNRAGTNVVQGYLSGGPGYGNWLNFVNSNTNSDSTDYEASTGPGDSGGPMFVQSNNTWYVTAGTYGAGSQGFIDTPTAENFSFITSTTGLTFTTAAPSYSMLWKPLARVGSNSGGTGTWDLTATNFTDGVNDFSWDNSLAEDVTFGSATLAAGTVTITPTYLKGGLITAAGVIVHNLNFNTSTSGTYTIAAGKLPAGSAGGTALGTLTLSTSSHSAGNPTITANVNAVISAPLAGSATIVKAGPATLTLSGTNTLTGVMQITAGTLDIQNAAALGTGGFSDGDSTFVSSGATLSLDGGVSGFSCDEHIHLNGTGVGGNGALYNLTGNNTLTDPVSLDTAATVGVANGSSLSISGSVGSAPPAQFYGGNALTLIGSGTGVLNLDGSAHISSLTINGGTFNEQASALIDSGVPLTVGGGTFAIGAFNQTLGAVTLITGSINGSTGFITGSSYNVQSGSISAVLAGTGSLTKSTTGTVTVTSANTYSGITTISGGILSTNLFAIGGAVSGIGESSNAASNLIMDGGTLQYTGPVTSTDRAFTLTQNGGSIDASGSGALTLTSTTPIAFNGSGARTLTLSGSGSGTLDSAIGNGTGGATALVKSGVGGWTLNGTNVYSGSTNITGGKLFIPTNTALSPNSAISVSNGAQLNISASGSYPNSIALNGGTGLYVTQNGGAFTFGGTISLNANSTIEAFATTTTSTFSQPITGTGGLTLLGAGAAANHNQTFVMSGAGTYGSSTTIEGYASNVTLKIGVNNALPINTTLILAGDLHTFSSPTALQGYLDLSGYNQQLASIQTANGVSGGPGDDRVINSSTTASTLTMNIASGSIDLFSGILGSSSGNNFGLAMIGPGTMVLAGANTYTGATSINAGTLTVNGSITSPAVNVATGAVLNANGSLAANTVLLSNGITNLAPGAVAGISTRSFASINLGSGGLVTVMDPGPSNHANRTLVVTSALVFAGTTNAWQGQLDLASNDLVVKNGSIGTITNQIETGYKSGAFNGNGIISTTARNNSSHLTAIGAILNTGPAGAIYSTFDNQPVGASDVLVKYAYYGDANLDGRVDGSDYSRIDNGFLTHATGWSNGDFNYDGTVNGSDYTLIDNAFNSQGSSLSTQIASPQAVPTSEIDPVGTSVPEPSVSLGLAVGLIGLARRRRRRVGISDSSGKSNESFA